jgi:hypothetical protein
VERILQSEVDTTHQKIGRRYKFFKSLYFLVKWKSYPDNESTWEPGTNLGHTSESMERFYEEKPEALAISTGGQGWRGGGLIVRETKEYNYRLHQNPCTRDN